MDNSISTLTLPSPAKLNLFLHINGQRQDGYHELQTIFQFLDLSDQLTFHRTETPGITLSPPIPGVADEDNLIVKAAKALLPYQANSCFGVQIDLVKQLPMGGGIGGGSSNAATTLLALNTLWDCQLSLDKLAQIGSLLGADVAVFVKGFSAFAEGIGDILHPIEPVTPYYLLVKPDCHVSTVQIFTDKYLTRDTPPIKISHALKLDGHNDCLEVVLKYNPEVKDAYFWLKEHGNAKLTGTGACLFLAFDNWQDAENVRLSVPDKWQAWVCQGCNVSPTHRALNQWIEQQGV
ncbi:4-(cytidine 5'-diphospho)-2-C-methyl-D-erythritol kinase [Marinomonas epiphytica]